MTADEKKVFMDTCFPAMYISRSEILNAFGGVEGDNDKVVEKVEGMSDENMKDYIDNYYRKAIGKNFYVEGDDITETFKRYMEKTSG